MLDALRILPDGNLFVFVDQKTSMLNNIKQSTKAYKAVLLAHFNRLYAHKTDIIHVQPMSKLLFNEHWCCVYV